MVTSRHLNLFGDDKSAIEDGQMLPSAARGSVPVAVYAVENAWSFFVKHHLKNIQAFPTV